MGPGCSPTGGSLRRSMTRALWACFALGLFVLEVLIATVWSRVPVVCADSATTSWCILIYARRRRCGRFARLRWRCAVFCSASPVECAQYFGARGSARLRARQPDEHRDRHHLSVERCVDVRRGRHDGVDHRQRAGHRGLPDEQTWRPYGLRQFRSGDCVGSSCSTSRRESSATKRKHASGRAHRSPRSTIRFPMNWRKRFEGP